MSVRPRERAMSDTAERFMSEKMGAPEACGTALAAILVARADTTEKRINTIVSTTCIGAFGGMVFGGIAQKPLHGIVIGAAAGFILGVTKVGYDAGEPATENDATEKRVARLLSSVCIGGATGLGVGQVAGKPLEGLAIGAGAGLVFGLTKEAYDSYRARR